VLASGVNECWWKASAAPQPKLCVSSRVSMAQITAARPAEEKRWGVKPTQAIREAKKQIPNLDSCCPFYESLYVNPKESTGFTGGARQMNPGFTESRGWQ